MAIMIPNLTNTQLGDNKSFGEVQVYKSLRDGLPDDYTVFFQIGWILKNENAEARDGETDFIVCHPHYGYFCLEIKGGGISHDAQLNKWFSIDKYQKQNEIKDPFSQSLRSKYSIRAKLNENELWKKNNLSKVISGHAVFFPNIGEVKSLSRPDMPIVLIGSSKDLSNIKSWVESVFNYWCSKVSTNNALGRNGINIMKEIFAKSYTIRPLVSSVLKEEEVKRLTLTNEQMKILDFLRRHRRVAISGGAGTGKTVLAVEKAKRLANEGFNTLLTCYNRPLADHLAEVCFNIKNLSVMSFHQLCEQKIKQAHELSGRDFLKEAKLTLPGKDEFDVQIPNALSYSLDIISNRFDAIVCDEGQDFREEFWFPLEL